MFWTSTNAHGSSGGGSSSEHLARTACRRIEIVIGFARAGFPSCRTPETVMMRGLRIAVRGMRVLFGGKKVQTGFRPSAWCRLRSGRAAKLQRREPRRRG